MIISFSEFLKKQHINPKIHKDALQGLGHQWFEDLMKSFVKLREFFPRGLLQLLRRSPLDSSSPPQISQELQAIFDSSHTSEEFIQNVDSFFVRVTNILNLISNNHLKSQPFARKNLYPFEARCSGVKIVGRVRLLDGSLLENCTFESRSFEGANPREGKEIYERVRTAVGSCQWLNKSLDKLGKRHHEVVNVQAPHAEDDWFVQFGQILIERLAKHKDRFSEDDLVASDHFPASYLYGPRIEFVLSSSPCVDCQIYFRALHQALQDNNINLPIVIFSDFPFNTGENYGEIFIVTQANHYQRLSFRWLSPQLFNKRNSVQPMVESFNFNKEYRTILVLNIFGTALLPTLARSHISMISFFISSLLDLESTNYVMLDWVRHYFRQLLAMLPYDFSETSTKALVAPTAYKQVDYEFLSSFALNSKVLSDDKIRAIAAIAADKNNALLFFVELAMPHCKEGLYKYLRRNQHSNVQDGKLQKSLMQLVTEVRSIIYWDLSSAPPEVLHQPEYPDMPTRIFNQDLLDFRRKSGFIFSLLQFIIVARQYQYNILNSILSHPGDSPLRDDNENYDDQEMSLLIYTTRKAIYQLAFRGGQWNMQILERIFDQFRQRRFEERLDKQIKESKESKVRKKYIPNLNRIFSQQQVRMGRMSRYISLQPSEASMVAETDISETESSSEEQDQLETEVSEMQEKLNKTTLNSANDDTQDNQQSSGSQSTVVQALVQGGLLAQNTANHSSNLNELDELEGHATEEEVTPHVSAPSRSRIFFSLTNTFFSTGCH